MVLVEANGIVVDGVDHHEPGGDHFGGLHDSPERLSQGDGAEPLALEAAVEGKTGEEGCGNALGIPSPKGARELVFDQDVGRERVVADDYVVAVVPDKGAGHPPRLCPSGMLGQPRVECGMPAGEAGEVVLIAECLADQGHPISVW